MNIWLKTWLKRLVVLAVGLVVSYLIDRKIFPFFDQVSPFWVAILLTYLVSAYILLPLAMRVIRLFVKADHIPHHTTTPDGFACDPINMAIVATAPELKAAMADAGWHLADKRTSKSLARMVYSIITRKSYPNAPFSNLYLFGRHQDFGFQVPLTESPLHRHHVRFWAVRAPRGSRHLPHVAYWRKHHTSGDRRTLWLGAATLDGGGIGIIGTTAQITHEIHPDTNAEREFLVHTLKKAGVIKRLKIIKIGEPYTMPNRVPWVTMIADGELKLCELKEKSVKN